MVIRIITGELRAQVRTMEKEGVMTRRKEVTKRKE
jgi:hypothetical protein